MEKRRLMKVLWSLMAVFFFLFIHVKRMNAKHIIGGDVTYQCLGLDTMAGTVIGNYRIEFTMYRDCGPGGGAEFDNPAEIGVYRGNGSGGFNWIQTLPDAVLSNVQILQLEESPCQEIPTGICVQEGKYIFDVRLPVSDQSYMLNYQRCCRNVTINNIVNAEDTGASFGIEITAAAQQVCNDSPTFDVFPPILICSGQPLFASQAASDKQGDLLVYKFCSPKQGGGPKGTDGNGGATDCDGIFPDPQNCPPPLDDVIFKLPTYSFNNPVAADPALSINSETGLITGTPNLIGQFVVGVCVEEYRDGVLLSRVNRDFQFNVTECENFVLAGVKHDAQLGPSEYEVNSCGDFTIDFKNESVDPAFIDGYLWNFNIDGNVVSSREKDIAVTFPGLGSYDGFMVVNPDEDDAACRDTAYFEVNVYPDINADYSFAFDTCVAGPVDFVDMSVTGAGTIQEWQWNFNNEDTLVVTNPAYTFLTPGEKEVELVVTDRNLCKDTMTQIFEYLPAPPVIIIEPSTFFGCSPANIFFNNLSTPVDSTYDIFWDFGDGMSSTEISPTHVFTEVGKYDVSVEIISPLGCEIGRAFNNLIEVDVKPEADFEFDPKEPNSLNTTVNFQDLSSNAVRWQWEFGDQGASFERNPSFTFRDTGQHVIQLVAFHPSGCPDTMIQTLDVLPFTSYFMPNAFTPNADGDNDLFIGKGILTGMKDFSLRIFNRWGEQVFTSSDPLLGWNGQKDNSGADSQSGVYVYQLSYMDARGNLIEQDGFATLIR